MNASVPRNVACLSELDVRVALAPNPGRCETRPAVAILALKILLAPACVVAVSLAGRRWGATVAGLLGGFPVVGGPILLVVTLVHGDDFGADAALGSLLGLAAVAAFVVYARLAPRLRPLPTLLLGWAAFFAGIAVLGLLWPPVGVALAVAVISFELGRLLVPAPPPVAVPDLTPPWWDTPARALAALAMVLAITIASGSLGATVSGLLAPFPILTSVLIVFTHFHHGARETQVLIRGFLLGFYGFAAFSSVLAVALPELSTAASFLLAVAVAALVQLAVGARASRSPEPAFSRAAR